MIGERAHGLEPKSTDQRANIKIGFLRPNSGLRVCVCTQSQSTVPLVCQLLHHGRPASQFLISQPAGPSQSAHATACITASRKRCACAGPALLLPHASQLCPNLHASNRSTPSANQSQQHHRQAPDRVHCSVQLPRSLIIILRSTVAGQHVLGRLLRPAFAAAAANLLRAQGIGFYILAVSQPT